MSKNEGAAYMKDFIFVLFVGSVAISLTLFIRYESIPRWFMLVLLILLVLNYQLQRKEKENERD